MPTIIVMPILIMPLLAVCAVFIGLWVTGIELNITATGTGHQSRVNGAVVDHGRHSSECAALPVFERDLSYPSRPE
jgi:hypothetical protein